MLARNEISAAVAEEIASWRRVFAARRNGVDARNLLRKASIDLWRALEIDKTVHPESYGLTRQDVVDALADMAANSGIGPDDAQLIFSEAFKAPASNGDAYSDNSHHHDYRGDYQQDQNIESLNSCWEDPDISILDDRRGDLPEFPVEVLAPSCREWVERAAHGSGVTPAHVAIPLIGIVSSLIGTARRAQASRSWTQPLSVWAAVIGFSGSGKTPGLDTVRRALALVERDKKKKIADQQHAHEAKVEAAKAARDIWKEQVEKAAKESVVDLENYRAAKKAATPLPPPEAIVPGPFVAPRLYVSDATIERLAVLLTARPRGMLLIGDELAGLFLNMSRYSNGSDREFWLEAWNGGCFTVERMSREPIRVDHLLVGLIGGFQPDKLARSFDGDHDGLYGRVLFAWPSEPPYRELANDIAEIEPEIVNALDRITELKAGEDQHGEFAPRAIPLSPDALAAFEEFRQLAHNKKQALDGREREWMAKAQAHTLRLAGALEFVHWAFIGGEEPKHISTQSINAAVRLVHEYFWPHSRAALRQIGLSEKHVNARRVLRWLAASARDEFSREDIRVGCLCRTLDADQTQSLIDALAKSGWCKEITSIRKGAGRPARRWTVNPKLKGSQ